MSRTIGTSSQTTGARSRTTGTRSRTTGTRSRTTCARNRAPGARIQSTVAKHHPTELIPSLELNPILERNLRIDLNPSQEMNLSLELNLSQELNRNYVRIVEHLLIHFIVYVVADAYIFYCKPKPKSKKNSLLKYTECNHLKSVILLRIKIMTNGK